MTVPARIWDAQTGKQLHVLEGHGPRVEGVAFSPDSKLALTGGHDDSARLWDAQTGKLLHTLPDHTKEVDDVAFSSDGKIAFTGDDGKARLWDVRTGKLLRELQGPRKRYQNVAFTPDGKYLVTGSDEKTAGLWEVQSGKQLCQLMCLNDGTWAVVDSEGRYDGSNDGDIEGIGKVVGTDAIPLKEFRGDCYDPGLMAKHLGFNKEPLRKK